MRLGRLSAFVLVAAATHCLDSAAALHATGSGSAGSIIAHNTPERELTKIKSVIDYMTSQVEGEELRHRAVRLARGCEQIGAAVEGEPGRRDVRREKKRIFRVMRTELEHLLRSERDHTQDSAHMTAACESCLHALASLLGELHDSRKNKSSAENARLIMEVGMLSVVMDMLSRNEADLMIQEHGLAVLAQLALQDDAKARLRTTEAGGLGITAAALRRFPGDSAVQRHGVAILHYLASSYLPARQVIASEGLMPLVVAAMELHPEMAALQEAGAWTMMAMGVHNPEGSPEGSGMTQKELILASRGLEAVLSAMRTHPTNSAVQFGALASLQSLIGPQVDKPPPVHPLGVPFYSPFDAQTRDDFVAGGGIELIIDAMKDHSADVSIHHVSCGLLGTLVSPAQAEGRQLAKKRAFNAGVANTVVRSLHTNRAADTVAVECVAAIADLVGPRDRSDRFIARDFLRQGVARELTRVAEQHRYHATVQSNICTAFLRLFYGGDDRHKNLLGKEPAFMMCSNHDSSFLGFDDLINGGLLGNVVVMGMLAVIIDKLYISFRRGYDELAAENAAVAAAEVLDNERTRSSVNLAEQTVISKKKGQERLVSTNRSRPVVRRWTAANG